MVIDMNKSKIDWCDSTWNPVTGCLHGCEYCYARSIANRFGDFETIGRYNLMPYGDKCLVANAKCKTPYPAKFTPTLHRYHLNDYEKKKGRNIFVCSMADLFGAWVPDEWIIEVMNGCDAAPQHNYIFLTKNPKRYTELYEKGIIKNNANMWYGVTCTKDSDCRPFYLPCNVFVSIEPILEKMSVPSADWIIVGAETGRRKNKVVPQREWIENIVHECKEMNIPLFMKSSLADIWGEPLIQEFPEQLRRVQCKQ